MDWITGTIVAIGIAILCVFVVIPVKEFREILRRLRNKPHLADPAEQSFEVVRDEDRPQ